MSGTSSSSPYSAIYAFGDSLSDAGNVSLLTTLTGEEPVSPPYYTEKYASVSASVFSNGPTWVQDLSESLGLGQLAPSLTGGNDFAYGGAEAGSEPQNSDDFTQSVLDVPFQITQFETLVGKAPSSALYTFSIGANDLLAILADPSLSATQQTTDVTAAVNDEIADIVGLAKNGAKNFLVFNVPDLGVTPDVTNGFANDENGTSAALVTLATSLSHEYDSMLASQLATSSSANGYSYQILDSYDLIANAVANPTAYGISNATAPVWAGSLTNSKDGTLAASTTAAQDQYLFFDELHPTESGHSIIANSAQSLVDPSFVSQLDQTENVSAYIQAGAYLEPSQSIHSYYANITSDNVALFADAGGMFLQSGAGNDIVEAKSGVNVVDAGGGSNFLVSGTGTGSQDTFFVDGSGGGNTWNDLYNFHSGDGLAVFGYLPGVSKTAWTEAAGGAGATLVIDVNGNGSSYASDTFLGVSLAAAQNYAVVTGGSAAQPYLFIAA